jgi:sulfate permease, SulP family
VTRPAVLTAIRPYDLQADGIDDVDFTGGKTLLELAGELRDRGSSSPSPHRAREVRHELDRYGVTASVGADHVYDTLDDALAAFRREGARAPAGA